MDGRRTGDNCKSCPKQPQRRRRTDTADGKVCRLQAYGHRHRGVGWPSWTAIARTDAKHIVRPLAGPLDGHLTTLTYITRCWQCVRWPSRTAIPRTDTKRGSSTCRAAGRPSHIRHTDAKRDTSTLSVHLQGRWTAISHTLTYITRCCQCVRWPCMLVPLLASVRGMAVQDGHLTH